MKTSFILLFNYHHTPSLLSFILFTLYLTFLPPHFFFHSEFRIQAFRLPTSGEHRSCGLPSRPSVTALTPNAQSVTACERPSKRERGREHGGWHEREHEHV